MATVKEHYDILLSEIYTWLYGGLIEGKNRNTEFFKEKNILPRLSGVAIDLGAGSGFQSIPLAEIGFSVMAIDLNESLLKELSLNAQGLSVQTVQDDMIHFLNHCKRNAELIVCMRDTLTHLESKEQVIQLFKQAFQLLEKDGKLILTFRDLTHELTYLDRFIPLKNDDNTIFTCFLENEPETVVVHDLVYRNVNNRWEFQKSYYRKIKLAKKWVEDHLSARGFSLIESSITNGFITLIAKK